MKCFSPTEIPHSRNEQIVIRRNGYMVVVPEVEDICNIGIVVITSISLNAYFLSIHLLLLIWKLSGGHYDLERYTGSVF